MMCERVYQSEMCCEFSELCTTPCHSFTYPHSQIGDAAHPVEDHGLRHDQRQGDQKADGSPALGPVSRRPEPFEAVMSPPLPRRAPSAARVRILISVRRAA